jgi:hypothetical protein
MSSSTATPASAPAPAPQQEQNPYKLAEDVLEAQVWNPVFFAALEARGIVPQNAVEAVELKKMAHYLDSLEAENLQKAAGDRASWLAGVNARLAEAAGHVHDSASPEIKAAAQATVLQNPVIRDSALLAYDHLASQAA